MNDNIPDMAETQRRTRGAVNLLLVARNSFATIEQILLQMAAEMPRMNHEEIDVAADHLSKLAAVCWQLSVGAALGESLLRPTGGEGGAER